MLNFVCDSGQDECYPLLKQTNAVTFSPQANYAE
jgi:hypothetical protein